MKEERIMVSILTKRIMTRNNFIRDEKINKELKEKLRKLNERDLQDLIAWRG